MNKILIVVDMQNDFITGSLGTSDAQAIVPKVVEKIKEYQSRGDRILFTQDTHSENYLETQEGKHLPILHCVNNTNGWQITSDITKIINIPESDIVAKDSFGSLDLAQEICDFDYDKCLINEIERHFIKEIELCGLCTDICIVSNALIIKAALPEVKIVVDSSCCAGVTPEKHKAALEVMRSCQVEVI